MESSVEMVTFGVPMIPCLYEGYQGLINYIGILETIASIICYVNIYLQKKFGKISTIRNFWDGLYMH